MTTIKNLKIMMLAAATLLTAGITNAQEKKEKNADRKQEKTEQLAENLKAIKTAVKDSSFVIEANSIRGRHTYNYFVSPSTNFVKISGDRLVIQTANASRIGYNGLGGITVDGTIRDYDIYEEEHGVRVLIQMSSFALGFSTVNISVNASGNATAMLSTGYGGQATFSGDIYRLDDSGTFEGMSIL